MTAPLPPSRVKLAIPGATAVLESEGGAISSFRVGSANTELLARTPWADDTDDGWQLQSTSSEWHRRYRGGWHPLIPRALGPARVDGMDHPFHGEAAWRTWKLASTSLGRCTAGIQLRSIPLSLERAVTLQADGEGWALIIDQTITDLGGDGARIGWVEHPALRGELFDGSTISIGGGESVAIEPLGMASFVDLPAMDGVVTVASVTASLTIEIAADPSLFTRVYVWQERRATRGFPWYRRFDAVGIEPASQRHDITADTLGELWVPAGASINSSIRMTVNPWSISAKEPT